uniref:Uncharacterized protein n=1 Tax=Romanomermis culicivorax TaxID=13658 RepID=A0A915IMP4_ROMCU
MPELLLPGQRASLLANSIGDFHAYNDERHQHAELYRNYGILRLFKIATGVLLYQERKKKKL